MSAPPPLSDLDPAAARAMLEWLVEAGATEAIGEAPVDRYALPDRPPSAAGPAVPAATAVPAAAPDAHPPRARTPALAAAAVPATGVEAVDEAERVAAAAADLPALRAAMEAFGHCELKKGARQVVFAAGHPEADLMIVGEAPGAGEDRTGIPFVGASGQLLDRMLAAIGLDRASPEAGAGAYITNVLPWRPPGNRKPTAAEIAMLRPFLLRHIALVNPKAVLLMGNTPLEALTGSGGITRRRGLWIDLPEAAGAMPALPTFHPAFLLRDPLRKREAWADLQAMRARLRA